VAPLAPGGSWALQTLHALGQPPPAAYRGLRIHAGGGEALHALWQALDAANESIDVCTFILGRDELGRQFVDRLIAKARAGVRVRLLLDGMGSLMAGRPNLQPLRDAGAAVALFVPPLHSPLKGRTNLRDHRKMLIVDAAAASPRLWSGGRNLASEYFEGEPGKAAWHDLSFDLSGPLVHQALALFERDWAFAHTERPPQQMPPEDGGDDSAPAHGAQLVASGPDQLDDTVYALLISAAYRARRRIALVTPYFVPDAALQMALCLAARRGVQVDLLLPARSNHRLSDIARGRALRALGQAGARIWLAPQMLHAKLAVVDDELALAGSANLDSRSLFLNYELMVAFHEAADVARFGQWFERERSSASPYAARRAGLARDLAEGMVLWVGFQL
jgi:cardiolipin synthase